MKRARKLLAMILLAAAMLCGQAVQAFAASAPVTAEIPVKVSLTGGTPNPAEEYTFVLKADSEDYPMPEGSLDGEAVIKIEGAGEGSFRISYSHPGTYTYTVFQRAGSDKDCGYDRCVYAVTIYVTNSEAEPGTLETTVKAEKQHIPGTKCPIEFVNTYPEPEPNQPEKPGDSPKTGDESNLPLSFLMVGGGALTLAVLFLTRKKKESGSTE